MVYLYTCYVYYTYVSIGGPPMGGTYPGGPPVGSSYPSQPPPGSYPAPGGPPPGNPYGGGFPPQGGPPLGGFPPQQYPQSQPPGPGLSFGVSLLLCCM